MKKIKILLLISTCYVVQFLINSAVFAQPWAEAMFPATERRQSFGNVAMGAESVLRFQFKNPYKEDIHIASVKSSCNCTTPSWPKTAIKHGETGEIVARLNTEGQFRGERSATLTVVIDQPSRAEVQLQVTGYIRPDVVISPGMAEFGTVSEGVEATKELALRYAGKPDWKLTKVECTNPHIYVQADEMKQSNGFVNYKILVTIRDTMSSGYVHDMVRFTTNDTNPNSATVMFPVHAYVTTPLVAKPSPLVIGFVQPGETVKKNIVLRSDTKFRITKITSKDRRFQFYLSDGENNNIHVLPIAFTADSSFGALSEPIIIHTTLAGQKQMQLVAQGMVYDESYLDFPKEMLAGQHSGQAQPLDSRIQINMAPKDDQSQETASMMVEVTDDESGTDEIVIAQQEAPPTPVTGLNDVPKIAANTPDAGRQIMDPPVIAHNITPKTPFPSPSEIREFQPVPTIIVKDSTDTLPPQPFPIKIQPDSDLEEVPFHRVGESAGESAVERTNEMLAQSPPLPSPNTGNPSGNAFALIEEATQPSPANTAQANSPQTAVVSHPKVEPPSTEASSSGGLKFDKPSIRENLNLLTQPKPKPVDQPGAFDVVGSETQNTTSGNIKPPVDIAPLENVPRITHRTITEVEPPKVPPVPGMEHTEMPATTPFPVVVTPTVKPMEPEVVKPQTVNDPPVRPLPLSIPSATAGAELDSDMIAKMFGGGETKPADTEIVKIAQAPTRDFIPEVIQLDDSLVEQQVEQPLEQDTRMPMGLQPFQPENIGVMNSRLMTIDSMSAEDFDDGEMIGEGFGPEQLDVEMPPLGLDDRLSVLTAPRERVPYPDDLPIMGTSPSNNAPQVPRPGNNVTVPHGGRAPIPPTPPGRQPVTGQVPPNSTPNATGQRVPLPTVNAPQRPGVQQQQLTPQQIQQMQRMQAQQRQAAAMQQGRTVTPTPPNNNNNRVTQAPVGTQQPLVVPPAPAVPSTPMMAPAPMFRR